MLRHLSIRDFALIDRLDLAMEVGFTTLTGETGAGKSILLDAVALLAGGRAHQELIRTGADEAVVQGVVAPADAHRDRVRAELERAGIPVEDALIVRRVISRSGANRVFVNDSLATVGLLQRVVGPLVEIVGQHEQLALTRPETHRRMIDRFAGHTTLLAKMTEAHERWRAAQRELERLQDAQSARHDRMDLLRFQQAELEGVEPIATEFDELERSLGRARNQDKLRNAVEQALAALYDGDDCANDRLALAEIALSRVEDPAIHGVIERLRDALGAVEEGARLLRGIGGELEEELDVDALETRHQLVKAAMRRFGVDAPGLVQRLADVNGNFTSWNTSKRRWLTARPTASSNGPWLQKPPTPSILLGVNMRESSLVGCLTHSHVSAWRMPEWRSHPREWSARSHSKDGSRLRLCSARTSERRWRRSVRWRAAVNFRVSCFP